MSRYGFTKFDAEVVVGWDNPCQTLFGDVEDSEGELIVSTMMIAGERNIQTVDKYSA